MNDVEFSNLVQSQVRECEEVLRTKGSDYSDAKRDRLSNFKLVSQLIANAGVDCSPEMVWTVYFLKHIFAIVKGMNGKLESEPLGGRFTDAHNYLFLGRGLSEEKFSLDDAYRAMAAFQAEQINAPVGG
jgi:hypothetical protein